MFLLYFKVSSNRFVSSSIASEEGYAQGFGVVFFDKVRIMLSFSSSDVT